MICLYCDSLDIFWDVNKGIWICNDCHQSFEDEGKIE